MNYFSREKTVCIHKHQDQNLMAHKKELRSEITGDQKEEVEKHQIG